MNCPGCHTPLENLDPHNPTPRFYRCPRSGFIYTSHPRKNSTNTYLHSPTGAMCYTFLEGQDTYSDAAPISRSGRTERESHL